MSTAPKFIIKLDKERELKFTMPAIVSLDELFNIDVYQFATYQEFPPAKVVSLIWAGQLASKNPLKRHQIAQYLPTSMEKYMEVCKQVALALKDALKDITPAA